MNTNAQMHNSCMNMYSVNVGLKVHAKECQGSQTNPYKVYTHAYTHVYTLHLYLRSSDCVFCIGEAFCEPV